MTEADHILDCFIINDFENGDRTNYDKSVANFILSPTANA